MKTSITAISALHPGRDRRIFISNFIPMNRNRITGSTIIINNNRSKTQFWGGLRVQCSSVNSLNYPCRIIAECDSCEFCCSGSGRDHNKILIKFLRQLLSAVFSSKPNGETVNLAALPQNTRNNKHKAKKYMQHSNAVSPNLFTWKLKIL